MIKSASGAKADIKQTFANNSIIANCDWRMNRYSILMTSKRFTVVCEYRGGTYVSQVKGVDINDAVRSWIELLMVERPLGRSSTYLARNLSANLNDDPPISLEGLEGGWCVSTLCGGEQMLANLVASE